MLILKINFLNKSRLLRKRCEILKDWLQKTIKIEHKKMIPYTIEELES